VGLAAPGEVSPVIGWMAASFAVADGRVVGVGAVKSWNAYDFDGATIPEPDLAVCAAGVVGDITQHVVVQAITSSGAGGRAVLLATWFDPFRP